MDLSKARSLIQELYFYARLHLHPTLPAPGRVPHTALCCDIPANLSINLGKSRQQQQSVKKGTFKGQTPFNTADVIVGLQWELLQAP